MKFQPKQSFQVVEGSSYEATFEPTPKWHTLVEWSLEDGFKLFDVGSKNFEITGEAIQGEWLGNSLTLLVSAFDNGIVVASLMSGSHGVDDALTCKAGLWTDDDGTVEQLYEVDKGMAVENIVFKTAEGDADDAFQAFIKYFTELINQPVDYSNPYGLSEAYGNAVHQLAAIGETDYDGISGGLDGYVDIS